MRRGVLLGAGAAALALGIAWWQNMDGGEAAQADLAEGATLYAEHCAACHGADLEGLPDWRTPGPDGRLPAPPHDETGHTWHHADAMLFEYTKFGGQAYMTRQGIAFESGMPGFADQLTDRQILDVLAFIRSTWPERIRAAQAERTRAAGN